jgi:D-arginine dehydrogenase
VAETADILIIGGGVGGLSAAAALAPHARVVLLEAEEQTGFHSSGRSATMFHYALGNPLVRQLTRISRSLFDDPPPEFESAPGYPLPILVHARAEEIDELDRAAAEMAAFTTLERVDEARLVELCPILRAGDGGSVAGLADHGAMRIDQHALMQGYVRRIRIAGGRIETGRRIAKIGRYKGNWIVTSERGDRFTAPILVNAAGAWGDVIAQMAGVAPIGLSPLRRTIITFDAPAGVDPARLPFAKTVRDELYFSGESGRLFASPMDEGPSEPCDSQPDEIDVATAAYRVEERTTVEVRRVHARWSGLRTFAPDRIPVLGFDPEVDGFFWCVGQGGAGLQTSPGSAAVVESLIAGTPWPLPDVAPEALGPVRFVRQSA